MYVVDAGARFELASFLGAWNPGLFLAKLPRNALLNLLIPAITPIIRTIREPQNLPRYLAQKMTSHNLLSMAEPATLGTRIRAVLTPRTTALILKEGPVLGFPKDQN